MNIVSLKGVCQKMMELIDSRAHKMDFDCGADDAVSHERYTESYFSEEVSSGSLRASSAL